MPIFLFWIALTFYELAGLGLLIGLKWYIPFGIAIIFPPIAILIGFLFNIWLSIVFPFWWILGAPMILIAIIYPLRSLKS